jgi:hypothetical protein
MHEVVLGRDPDSPHYLKQGSFIGPNKFVGTDNYNSNYISQFPKLANIGSIIEPGLTPPLAPSSSPA